MVNSLKTNANEFESDEMIADYVKSEISDKPLTFNEISNGLESGRKYVVKSGEKSVFNFTLREKEERSSFGFRQYEFDGIQAPGGKVSVSVAVPSGYSLYLNGIRVGQEHITERGRKIRLYDYMPEGVQIPEEDVYTVDGFFLTPEITADNGADRPADVRYLEDEDLYEVGLLFNDELEEEFAEYIIEAAEAISIRLQNDSSFYYAAKYIDPDSDLYLKLRSIYTGDVTDHNGWDFDQESASEFIRYDEDTFSCRVKLRHILYKRGSEDHNEYLDVIMFLHRVNGKWLIFDRFDTN